MNMETYYGSNAVDGTLMPQPSNSAAALSRSLIGTLRRSGDAGATALAAVLDACQANQRCLDGACPQCTAALQTWFTSKGMRLLNARAKADGAKSIQGHYRLISVIPIVLRDDGYETMTASISKARRTVERHLRDAGITFFLGGVDVSYDRLRMDLGSYTRTRGCAHVWGFITEAEFRQVEKELRRRFTGGFDVERPFRSKLWDGRPRALEYAVKNTFSLRTTIPGAPSAVDRASRRQNTRHGPLLAADRLSLARRMSNVGLAARLSTIGVDWELFGAMTLQPAWGGILRL